MSVDRTPRVAYLSFATLGRRNFLRRSKGEQFFDWPCILNRRFFAPSCRFTWKQAWAGVNLSTTAPIAAPPPFRTRSKRRDRTKELLLFLLFSEATMSAHAFEVLSRARNEIEVCHTAEGHRFKFFVITNAHGKRILSESVEVVAKEGATHTPEFFSAHKRCF